MASFDIFSQPQGPVTPISLFADAATAGINAGNALPTKTTAAIKGAISGFNAGLDIAQDIQNIQIRQNQIDQLPIENQVRQEQLENLQLTNDLNKLKVQNATELQGLALDDERAKLEASTTKLKQEKLLREKSQAFLDGFSKATPEAQAQMLLSGQFQDVLSANKTLNDQVWRLVAANPNNGLDDQTRKSIGTYLTKSGIKSSYDRAYEQTLPKYQAVEGRLLDSPVLGALVNETGLSQTQVLQNIKPVLRGQYELVPGTNQVAIDPRTGNAVKRGVGKDAVSLEGIDFLFTDPRTGDQQILGSNIDDAEKKAFRKEFDIYNGYKNILDGTGLKSDLDAVDRKAQQTPTRNQPQVSLQADSSAPFRERIAKSALNVSDTTLKAIAPSLERLEKSLVQEVLPSGTNRKLASDLFQNTVVDTLSRRIADAQFEESPAIQSQYTPATVDEYNRQLTKDIEDKYGRATARVDNLIEPFLASSPKDLYYKKQQTVINESVRKMLDQFIQLANARATATLARQSNTQRLITELSGIASAR